MSNIESLKLVFKGVISEHMEETNPKFRNLELFSATCFNDL